MSRDHFWREFKANCQSDPIRNPIRSTIRSDPSNPIRVLLMAQDNGKHGNLERFVQRQYTLAEKWFSRIVMYIPPMSDSSL